MTQETPMTATGRARKPLKQCKANCCNRKTRSSLGYCWAHFYLEPQPKNNCSKVITEAEEAMKERCHDIAAALDSGRGNEKEIAAAIRALGES